MRARLALGMVGMVALMGTTACGGGEGTTAASINGCQASTAEDHTKENPVMIMFGDSAGEAFSPACVKVAPGSGVMFMGDLSLHPLSGGVAGATDATSPIEETKTGMAVTFDNLPAGQFGFFCEEHDASDMHGALFVQ